MKTITSRDNPFYKWVKRLSQSSRFRRKAQCILLEGTHLIEEWHQKQGAFDAILVADDARDHLEIAPLLPSLEAKERIALPRPLFDEIAPVEHSVGILGVVKRPPDAPIASFSAQADAVWIDEVQDPGNIGTLLRTALAADIRQILVSHGTDSLWSPKVLRSAMGAHFSLALFDAALFLTHRNGSERIIGTQLDATQTLYDTDLRKPNIWVLGNEGQGIRPEVAAHLTESIKIPMSPQSESLNVAISAAICFFEQQRQRHYCVTKTSHK